MPKTNKQKTNANKRKAKAKPQFDKNKKTKSAQVSSEKPTIVAKDNGKNKKHVSVSSEKPTIVAEKQPDDAIATNSKMDDILASAIATSQHIDQKKLGDLTVDEIMEYLVERKYSLSRLFYLST
jgi:hypothetical protein